MDPLDPDRWVLHVDLDEFLAAVEVLRRPELAGTAVIVGGRGDPTERAVVSTASYAARERGVRSGMPLKVAARRCPDATFLPVDRPVYEAASEQVMDVLRDATWDGHPVVVEVLGWDEAFVAAAPGHGDLGGQDGAEAAARAVRAAVLERTRLHCSVGIGNNRLQAKIATDHGKPRGQHVISHATWFDQLGDRPTTALWGVGSRIAARLAALGIGTVRELAGADPVALAAALGPSTGPHYRRVGRGVDTGAVDPTPWVPRGHGREETFQRDLVWAEVPAALRVLAARVSADVAREGRAVERVGIKVRYPSFHTVTRIHKLPAPTTDPTVLADEAVALLARVEPDRPVRLLGVRLEMVPPDGGYPR